MIKNLAQRNETDLRDCIDLLSKQMADLQEKADSSQQEIKDFQQKAVSSQQESKDFQQRVVSSQQEIKVLTNQVTHITKVYVVSYQAILRRSLLHNARKSICEEMGKIPLRDAKTGYLKWNSALTDILNSTEPWLGRKFTRQNAIFVLLAKPTLTSMIRLYLSLFCDCR